MVKAVEMDERVPLSKQLEKDAGPVILINTFTMNSDDVDQLLKIWTSAAGITKKFPGVISVSFTGELLEALLLLHTLFSSP